jgi:hypothetical protein
MAMGLILPERQRAGKNGGEERSTNGLLFGTMRWTNT